LRNPKGGFYQKTEASQRCVSSFCIFQNTTGKNDEKVKQKSQRRAVVICNTDENAKVLATRRIKTETRVQQKQGTLSL
jgi:hypothetical protein